MFDTIVTALFLAIPLLVSGSFHMWVVSKNRFASLAIPIHLRTFGANKTWRGIVVMLLATIPGVWLAQAIEPLLASALTVSMAAANPVLLGLWLGLGYVIPELPNSFIKRRLNINPGEPSQRFTLLFSLLDQADSAIGCALVYWLVLHPPLDVVVWMVVLGPLVHLVANVALYACGLRKQPF